VGVGVDGERRADFDGLLDVVAAEIEPARVRVDLKGSVVGDGGLGESLHVDVESRAAVQQSPGRVAEDVHLGVFDGGDEPLGPVAVEGGVRRGDDAVQLGEHAVVDADGAVLADVRFDAGEHAEVGVACRVSDRLGESEEVVVIDADAADHPRAGRVIGDGEIFVAERLGGGDQLGDGALSVGRVGVEMEITAKLALLDERREVTGGRGVDLAVVLAELRRDVIESERLVHRALRLAGDPASDALAGVGIVDVGHVEDAVLVHLQPRIECAIPDHDVVVAAAGEILKRTPPFLGGDDAEIDAQSVDAEARFRRAGLDDLTVELGELLDDRLAVVAGREQVDVADGGPPASERAGGVGGVDGVDLAKRPEQSVGERPRVTE